MFTKKNLVFALLLLLAAVPAFAQTDEFHLDETYSLNSDGTILLKSDDADVRIIGSTRNDVHVKIDYVLDVDGLSWGDSEEFVVKAWVENGTLFIEEQPRETDRTTIGNVDEKYTILIEVPTDVSLKLRGDDEDYNISEIAGEIRVDADDADAILASCSGNYFAFRLDDGTVKMDQGRGKLFLNVDDGNAFIKNGSFKTIKLDTDDGEFRIQNRISGNGQFEFDMDDGTIEFSLNNTGSGSSQIEMDTDDGNFSLHTDLRNGDEYDLEMGDADIEFYALSGGGTFTIRHDDADISSDSGYQIITNNEGFSKYRLGNGGATIKIHADDADIELRD